MSFRKRNIVVPTPGSSTPLAKSAERFALPGTRSSPLDGRLTISTGTRSLDVLLAGHAGLSLGTCLLIGEVGTTDFGGALLRYYAAEGLTQGHNVHVLGVSESWSRDLPGLTSAVEEHSVTGAIASEKMKIAWRYERLGEFGRERSAAQPISTHTRQPSEPSVFCHSFDLSKRLILSNPSLLNCIPIAIGSRLNSQHISTAKSPLTVFLQHLTTQLSASSPSSIHRVIIPNLLSPAIYPHMEAIPEKVLPFLHALRALSRSYPAQMTVFITLPLSLYPRTTGLTRWIELLCDGVLELAPFPSHSAAMQPPGSLVQEETPQGMLKVHRLPIFHEKGGGDGESNGVGDDLAFTLSKRRGLVIKPFSLPPIDGDTKAQEGELGGDHSKNTKRDIEF